MTRHKTAAYAVTTPCVYGAQLELYMAADPAFWAQVAIGKPDECWPWKATIGHSGYGHYKGNSNAHVRAYEAKHGRIPIGLEACHNCHNAACTNPDHIRADTHKANCIESGLRRRGKPLKVLTEAMVRAARLMRAAGRKIREIAAEFKVNAETLAKAIRGDTWAWVTA